MIRACPGPALPFIRVPDANEGDVQKAVDIGALGVIVPMVDTIEKIRMPLLSPNIHRLAGAARGAGNTERCGDATTGRPPMTTS